MIWAFHETSGAVTPNILPSKRPIFLLNPPTTEFISHSMIVRLHIYVNEDGSATEEFQSKAASTVPFSCRRLLALSSES